MTSEGEEPLANVRILVVDDEPDALVFTRTVLQDAGATVFEATGGEEALRQVKEQRPDLVTLDLGMVGMSGVEVFDEMRADYDLAGIPVCIITGRPELRRLIYEGASGRPEGYLCKPVDAKTLVMNVRRILELHRRKKA